MVQAAVCIGFGEDCEGLESEGGKGRECSCNLDHGLCMLCYMPVPLTVAWSCWQPAWTCCDMPCQ